MSTEGKVLQVFKEKLSDYFDIITVSKCLNNTCIVNFTNTENKFNYQRILNLDFNDKDISAIVDNMKLLIKYM